jgi:hypothetical protein
MMLDISFGAVLEMSRKKRIKYDRLSIDDFIRVYWPLRYVPDFTIPARKEDERLLAFLTENYGRYAVNKYLAFKKEERGKEESKEFVDHLYETGMCEQVCPITTLRARETLRYLLGYLSEEDYPFALADLGCGYGKIAVGLALYLRNLKQVHVVERIGSAFPMMGRVKRALDCDARDLVNRKLVNQGMDYLSAGFRRNMLDYPAVDVFLLSAPSQKLDKILDSIFPLMHPDSRIVTCYSEYIPHKYLGCDVREVLERMSKQTLAEQYDSSRKYNISFKVLDAVKFFPGGVVVFSEGRKV